MIRAAFSSWRGTLLLAIVCWVVSLVVTALALSLASLGAPLPVFLLLFGWLLTLGLPTSLAIVLVLSRWQGISFEAFLGVVVGITFIFNFLCLSMVRQLVSWRGAKP